MNNSARYKEKPSKLAQRALYLDGDYLSLAGRNYILPIYDHGYRNIILKCGRQVEKSSTIRFVMLLRSIFLNHHRSLYVSPSQSQTSDFAKELTKIVDTSPFIHDNFTSTALVNQTLERQFTNGSTIKLRAAHHHADRCRGIAAKDLYIDEIQDMRHANIAVIEECQSHYQDISRRVYSGTPKTFNNPIELTWKDSTQCEWMVRCHGCNTFNNLGIENIGKLGIICSKCGHRLNPQEGIWAIQKRDALFWGFRISQLMVPFSSWDKILEKYERFSPALFHNEVLGLSFDSAEVPFTEKILQDACVPDMPMIVGRIPAVSGYNLVMGVDWGTSEESKSKTVVTVGYWQTPEVFQVIYVKKFGEREKDPIHQTNEIARIFGLFSCVLVAVDWGFGHVQNKMLRQKIGQERVAVVYYSHNQKKHVAWNKKGHMFVVNKPKFISDLAADVKLKKTRFFKWQDFLAADAPQDFLNEYIEYNESTRNMQYDHKPGFPDDALHSCAYARFAGKIFNGNHLYE